MHGLADFAKFRICQKSCQKIFDKIFDILLNFDILTKIPAKNQEILESEIGSGYMFHSSTVHCRVPTFVTNGAILKNLSQSASSESGPYKILRGSSDPGTLTEADVRIARR